MLAVLKANSERGEWMDIHSPQKDGIESAYFFMDMSGQNESFYRILFASMIAALAVCNFDYRHTPFRQSHSSRS